MSMMKEFKDFAMKGNVVDMAVGIIIGGAFGTIIKSLVDDVLMPPIGLLLGGVDFSNIFVLLKEGAKAAAPYAGLADAKAAGARGGKRSAAGRRKKKRAAAATRVRRRKVARSAKRSSSRRKARLVKGSAAARRYMAKIRRMRRRK